MKNVRKNKDELSPIEEKVKNAESKQPRELKEDELEQVTGGNTSMVCERWYRDTLDPWG